MLRDFRLAFRALAKTPGFLAIAVMTLAVGIGATTAVFCAVNSLLIRPLPYADAERLVIAGEIHAEKGIRAGVSRQTFELWQANVKSLDGVAAFVDNQTFPLSGNAGSLSGSRVSANFFEVLGVRAVLGRTFTVEDARPDAPKVAVLSHTAWVQRWAGDPSILGRTIDGVNEKYAIVGVLPPDFRMLYSSAAVWALLDGDDGAGEESRELYVIGRLRPRETLARALTEMGVQAEPGGWAVWAKPIREYIVGPRRPVMILLFVTVALLLVTACANLATLLLARAAGRAHEVTIRLALGAKRRHLVRQSLAEAMVIAGGGAVVGLLATVWIRQIAIASVPELRQFVIDGNVLLFTAGTAMLSAVCVALGPALVREQRIVPTHNRSRLRCGFVIAQTALAVTLLVGAGVLVRSFAKLHATDPGFRSQGILVAELSLPSIPAYATEPGRAALVRSLVERCRTVFGVQTVAAATSMPLFGAVAEKIEVEGRGREESATIAYRSITADYLRLFDVPLRRGRPFDERDVERAPRVVIVNERAAALFWPGVSPLEQRIRLGGSEWATVVGIAADTRSIGLRRPPVPEVFAPYAQNSTPQISVALRTDGDPLALLAGLRENLAQIDRQVTISYSNSMTILLDEQLALVRALSAFSSVFAGIALLLASMGLCGVVSYLFAQRTKEIGIRVAVGATRADILRMVAVWGGKLALCGLLAGNVAGFAIAAVFGAVLPGVAGADGLVFAVVTVIVGAAGVAAMWVPAMRAASIEPTAALRCE